MTKPKKNAGTPMKARSPQALDGRSGRAKTVKRKWWGVEYESQGLGIERSERLTKLQASKAAIELGKACRAWVVEVVERRRRIQAFEPQRPTTAGFSYSLEKPL